MWKPNKKQLESLKLEYIKWSMYPSEANSEERAIWVKDNTANKERLIKGQNIPEEILVDTWKQGMVDSDFEDAELGFENWISRYLNEYNIKHPLKDNAEYTAVHKPQKSLHDVIESHEKNRRFKIIESLVGSLILTSILGFAGSSLLTQADDADKNGLVGFLKPQEPNTKDEEYNGANISGFNGVSAPSDIGTSNAIPADVPLKDVTFNVGDVLLIPAAENQVINNKETQVHIDIPFMFFDRLKNNDAINFVNQAGIHLADDEELSNYNYQVLRYAYKVPTESDGSVDISSAVKRENGAINMGMAFICKSTLAFRSYDTTDAWPVDETTKEILKAYTYNYFVTLTSTPGEIGEGFVIFREDKRYSNWYLKIYSRGDLTANGMYTLDISD